MTYEFIRDCVQYPNGRLYLARKKDRTVGTVLGFASRSELFLWQGSRAREEYPIGTENLLIARMIEDACAEGIRTVDLGASLGDPGIEKFKESFGAEKTEYTILKWTHPFLRLFKKE
jgi:CelD/BcsL family acetyltransferase involved in cellulose biosynthesis